MSGTRTRRPGSTVGSSPEVGRTARHDLGDTPRHGVADAGRLTLCQTCPDPFTRDGRLAPGPGAVAGDL